MNNILTKRLILKPLQKCDDDLCYNLHSDPSVMKFLRLPDQDIFETKKWINEFLKYSKSNVGLGIWTASLKENKEFIGWGMVAHIERNVDYPINLGFRLHEKFWNHGYAFEISKALINYSQALGLNSISAITAEENLASQKVLEKCDFSYLENRLYYNLPCKYYEIKL